MKFVWWQGSPGRRRNWPGWCCSAAVLVVAVALSMSVAAQQTGAGGGQASGNAGAGGGAAAPAPTPSGPTQPPPAAGAAPGTPAVANGSTVSPASAGLVAGDAASVQGVAPQGVGAAGEGTGGAAAVNLTETAQAPQAGEALPAGTVRGGTPPGPSDPRLAGLLSELRQGFSSDLPYFGLSLFGYGGTQAVNWKNIPIDPYYQLGPGDVILVNVWGTLALNLQLPVNSEGFVVVPGGNRLYVNGLTFGQLEEVLLRELRTRHEEALTPDKLESGQVRIEVKLGEVHGVQVLVTGQVSDPGGLTFDSPAVLLLDALNRAGGITSRGSLRNVIVRRGGEQRELDLYDLLVSGEVDVSRFMLRQGDVVFVPYRERTVSIRGAVKQPAIYELAKGENLATLIEMAGGLTPKASLRKVQITRADEAQGTMLMDLDLERTPARTVSLKNGDQVLIPETGEQRRREIVRIGGGGVIGGGTYQLTPETTDLKGLLNKAGLYEDAIRDRAFLIRMGADYSKEKVVLDLDQAIQQGFRLQPEDQLIIGSRFQMTGGDKQVTLSGHVKAPGVYTLSAGLTLYDVLFNNGGFDDPDWKARTYLDRGDIVRVDKTTGGRLFQPFDLGAVLRRQDDFPLMSEDEVVVYAADRFRDDLSVSVSGEVRVPGKYELKQDMNLADLFTLAGGLREDADSTNVEISRMEPGMVPPFRSEKIKIDNPKGYLLKNHDIVHVRQIQYWGQPRMITVSGEVRFPGQYVLNQINERLLQVLQRAGGLSPTAFPEGVRFYRLHEGKETRVALDLSRALHGDTAHDLVLMDGDRVVIPASNRVVDVRGEVQQPQLVQYVPGRKAGYYADWTGGYTDRARRRGAYLQYANGLVRKANRRFWFDRAVPPGSALVVPERQPNVNRALWRGPYPYLVGMVVGGVLTGTALQYAGH